MKAPLTCFGLTLFWNSMEQKYKYIRTRSLLMMAGLKACTEGLLPPTLWYLHTSPQVGCAKCVCVELQSQCVFSRSSTGSSQKPENGSWGANSKHNSDTLTLPPYYYTRHSNTPNPPSSYTRCPPATSEGHSPVIPPLPCVFPNAQCICDHYASLRRHTKSSKLSLRT